MGTSARDIGPDDLDALVRFFDTISHDDAVLAYFRPHPFDRAMAEKICYRRDIVKDRYFAVFEDGDIVGYGMLRGWDEGYEVPAFGVCVRGDQRGKGLGRVLLEYAVEQARAAGAPAVMLKVFEDNAPARRLYENAGFVFTEKTPDGSQLVGRLQLAEERP